MYTLKPRLIRLPQKDRLYHSDKPIIALTGGIATGKSTVSQRLIQLGFEIIDADQLVKEIYAEPETIEMVRTHAPKAMNFNSIDFKRLRVLFFKSHKLRSTMEEFIYQRIPKHFVQQQTAQEQPFTIYDVPLLYEKKLEVFVDSSVVIYCTKAQQVDRLSQRDQTEIQTIERILKAQISIEDKKERADYIIDNSQDLAFLEHSIQSWIQNYFDPQGL